MANYAALRQWVQELLDDYSGEVMEFQPSQFLDACNFAVNNYCLKTTVTYVEKSLTVTNGICPVGNNLGNVFRVKFSTNWLLPTERDYEMARNQAFDSVAGDPKRWYPRSDYEIGVTPITATTLIVGYQEVPTALAADGDAIDSRIPAVHHRHLRLAAGAWLLMNDADSQDLSKSQAFMQAFDSLIGAKNDTVDPSERTIPSRPRG